MGDVVIIQDSDMGYGSFGGAMAEGSTPRRTHLVGEMLVPSEIYGKTNFKVGVVSGGTPTESVLPPFLEACIIPVIHVPRNHTPYPILSRRTAK